MADRTMPALPGSPPSYRVLRIITRLNIGGPSLQAARLTTALTAYGYHTTLLHGRIGAAEGDMSDLLPSGGDARYLDSLRRPIAPSADARALVCILRTLREVQPDIVHTHMAKAGLLGRIATLMYNRTVGRRRPARIVHTYHGHVLEGYFSRPISATFIGLERLLGRRTDALIAISPRIRSELIERFRIATPDTFQVIPLGFDLDALGAIDDRARAAARLELGVPDGAVVVTTVGRLTAIKNHALLLDAARVVADRNVNVLVLIAGDGELRPSLEAAAQHARLHDRVRFLGWRRDLTTIYGATDIFALTSNNEGTPVALIEAMAAGVPGVATDVGGVADVVAGGTGVLVPPRDPAALAAAIERLAASSDDRRRMGGRARASVLACYDARRLVRDVAALYDALLSGA